MLRSLFVFLEGECALGMFDGGFDRDFRWRRVGGGCFWLGARSAIVEYLTSLGLGSLRCHGCGESKLSKGSGKKVDRLLSYDAGYGGFVHKEKIDYCNSNRSIHLMNILGDRKKKSGCKKGSSKK